MMKCDFVCAHLFRLKRNDWHIFEAYENSGFFLYNLLLIGHITRQHSGFVFITDDKLNMYDEVSPQNCFSTPALGP
jgi:hypothetical protein